MLRKIIDYAVERPRIIMAITALLAVIAALQFPRIKVDTDPENMLPEDSPARVFHRAIKKEFTLYDMVVLGVVNDVHHEGVFNPHSLKKVYDITNEIKKVKGVIAQEIISLSTKDNIEQEDIGTVRFNWLMAEPPANQEEALRIKGEALDHPMFAGSVVSPDGKAVMIYVPIEKKDRSYEIAQEIRQILQKYHGEEKFYITGLPVANDQFGVEMFKQMAISAPLAGLVIFLLMWFFFKSFQLIIAPMLLAIATVLMTMGLLIGFGFPVHIMSSMIPIFLMPIAVLDSVHILSEFFDKYKIYQDKKKTMLACMDELFTPMLYTSLTSVAGFFSLSFSEIPPVQVFGVFVAAGVAIAWVLTMVFIPAFAMLLDEKNFQRFRQAAHHSAPKTNFMDNFLLGLKKLTLYRFKIILAGTGLVLFISVYGISRIEVNDNPVRWFTKSHPIRVSDQILNEHLGGTYEAYLVLEASNKEMEVFKEPAMLRYIEGLQDELLRTGSVGKVTSLSDIVKKVYFELLGGDKVNNVIPQTKEAVAQSLINFENSHKPDDLWHFVTPDYNKTLLWVQLKSGDNKHMSQVASRLNDYVEQQKPPFDVAMNWAGLTYINVIWQKNMVGGMLKNFLGSFIIVLFMMLFLFRSPLKALISMIPLSVTILFIYSLLGLTGKDYDMPVAVLSALTLGLSVDFAIHFIQRAIEIFEQRKNWPDTAQEMFGGPGRAIIRNALVVAIGFLPLLVAPLIPYRTVGFFMFMIMAVSSIATLLILPSIISAKPEMIFARHEKGIGCKCHQCILVAVFVALALAYVLHDFTLTNWTTITFICIGFIVLMAALCHAVSRRKICITRKEEA